METNYQTVPTFVEVEEKPSSMQSSAKIPRPPNAFMVFAQEQRNLLAQTYPDEGNKAISIRLGKMWKNLSKEIKFDYYRKADILNKEHKLKYPDYVYNPQKARLEKEKRRSLPRTIPRKHSKKNQSQISHPNVCNTNTRQYYQTVPQYSVQCYNPQLQDTIERKQAIQNQVLNGMDIQTPDVNTHTTPGVSSVIYFPLTTTTSNASMISSGQTSDVLNKIQKWNSPNCSLNQGNHIQCKQIQPSNTFQESVQLFCGNGTSCSEANNQVTQSSLINATVKNNVNAAQVFQLNQDLLPEVSQKNDAQQTIKTKLMKTSLKPEIQYYDFPYTISTNQPLAKSQNSERADTIKRNIQVKSRANDTYMFQNGDVSGCAANKGYPCEDMGMSTGTANVRRTFVSTKSDEIPHYIEGQQIILPSGQSTFTQSSRKTPTCYWAWRYWTEKGYSVPPQTATKCSCNSCYKIPSFRSCFQNRCHHPHPHRIYWSSGTPHGKIPEAFLPGEITPEGIKAVSTVDEGANRINPVHCRRNSTFVNRDTPSTSYSFPYSTENYYDTYWYMYSPISQGPVYPDCTSYKDGRAEGYKYQTLQQSEQEGVPMNQVNLQDISTPQQYPAVSESLYTQLTNVHYLDNDIGCQTNDDIWQVSQGIDAVVQGKITTDFGDPDSANAEYNTYSRRNIASGRDGDESNTSILPTTLETNHVLENKLEYTGQVRNDVNGVDSTALQTFAYSGKSGNKETHQPMDLTVDVAPETLAGSQSSENRLVIDLESRSPVARADQ